jgi:hypothetical protein
VPLSLYFWLDLCFVGVVGGGWRQNIDFRDFGWKIFGLNILRLARGKAGSSAAPRDDRKKSQGKKQKGRAMRSLV